MELESITGDNNSDEIAGKIIISYNFRKIININRNQYEQSIFLLNTQNFYDYVKN